MIEAAIAAVARCPRPVPEQDLCGVYILLAALVAFIAGRLLPRPPDG